MGGFLGRMMMSRHFEWRVADLAEQTTRRMALRDSAFLIDPLRDTVIDNDLSWAIATNCKEDHLVPFFAQEAGSCIGYTLFSTKDSNLPFALGEITLCRLSLQQWTLHGGCILSCSSEEQEKSLISTLFALVPDYMAQRSVLLIVGVPGNGQLYKMLSANSPIRRYFHIMRYGADYHRRFIEMPATYDEYLKQLGPKTRADLNRNCRKLREHVEGALVLRTYTDPGQVEEFMNNASAISERTYQWHLLNRGLRAQEDFRIKLLEAGARGWLRSYVLYCRNEPVAFMVGFLYRGRYYSTDIGYHPDWAKWSVGNVLHCEVVRDLIEQTKETRLFDFMGDRPTHQRLSNGFSLHEATFYLFPRTLTGTFLYYLLLATDTFSIILAKILDYLKLKTRIRNFLRRQFSRLSVS